MSLFTSDSSETEEAKQTVAEEVKEEPKSDAFNEMTTKSIAIGLNDRIGFVQHLFNDSNEDFNRVISQLNTFDTFEEASKQGDLALLARSLSDLQDQFPRTTLTAQASLLAAKTYFDKEKFSEAEKPLAWVVDHASDQAYVALASLRLSALAIERKDLAKARSWVESKSAPEGFQPLFDDRLGDIALIEGKHEEAKTRFTSAYKGMDESTEYRRLIEVKLGTLGVDIVHQIYIRFSPCNIGPSGCIHYRKSEKRNRRKILR